jgi:SAM-dependent MidA family methyltransferase
VVEQRFDERAAELKAHVDTKTNETTRLFGVVGEGLRAEIRQVAEGVTLANERIDALAVQMAQMGTELRTEIRLVADTQAELRTRVEALESKPRA